MILAGQREKAVSIHTSTTDNAAKIFPRMSVSLHKSLQDRMLFGLNHNPIMSI